MKKVALAAPHAAKSLQHYLQRILPRNRVPSRKVAAIRPAMEEPYNSYGEGGLRFFKTGFSPEAGVGRAEAGLAAPVAGAGGGDNERPSAERVFWKVLWGCCAAPGLSLGFWAFCYSLAA